MPGDSRSRQWLWLALLLAVVGCVHRPVADRDSISRNVQERTGQSIGPGVKADQLVLPIGLDANRKLVEDEAVLIALWNNPGFQELLTDLQLTRADLLQAGLLPNPEVIYFFQMPDKPFKYALELPIEAFWLRPIRLKIAREENERAAERLAQAALDLIRDTRQAYADLLLAKERLRVAQQAAKLRGGIADLAKKRLDAGDASVQEAAAARIDGLLAVQDAIRTGYEAPLAEERLRNLLGLGGVAFPIVPDETPLAEQPPFNIDDLANDAARTRPDALANEHLEAAAAERLRLARLGWFRLLGLLDATSGRDSHVAGPAFRVTLPIFNRNQGGVARAEAELEQAERRRLTVQNQIQFDVRQAHLRYQQASAELKLLKEKVRPEVEAAIRRAEKAYNDGGASYLIVLETTRQLIDANFREAQLHADLRRAWAEFERSIGKRLPSPSKVPGPSP